MTAGIDFALFVIGQLFGDEAAQAIQLSIEYAPAPPFDSGTPATAGAETLARVRAALAPTLEERRRAVEVAAARLVFRP